MSLSLQQFEAIISKQEGYTTTLSHYGSFNHCNVYEKFSMESDELEYQFIEMTIDNPDLEMMFNTILKQDIKEITYLWFSNQIQLRLNDNNRLTFDLMIEPDLDE